MHLLDSFNPKSAYQCNILMCPDIAIYKYDDIEEAIENVNQTDSSLCVSFYGNSDILQSRRHLFAAPNLFVNLPTVESEAALSLACRNKTISHKYQGVGVASSLSYPQVLVIESDEYKQLALLD